jgi:hypothetical protein
MFVLVQKIVDRSTQRLSAHGELEAGCRKPGACDPAPCACWRRADDQHGRESVERDRAAGLMVYDNRDALEIPSIRVAILSGAAKIIEQILELLARLNLSIGWPEILIGFSNFGITGGRASRFKTACAFGDPVTALVAETVETGKGPSDVAEQFRFNQRFGDGRAIYAQKGGMRARPIG